jgi:hypothetical protein
MGYNEIYLLGADCNYSSDPKNNYTEELRTKYTNPCYKREEDNQMKAYFIAGEYANQHDIKIYNATRGGRLELFQRVDLDAILKER